ncbi:hypothetical protein GCM10007973_29600 [Polymorphobacter multimanifer]|nr:hypothetical protein GCM10007973_29600 [Polymorphobacter multimanifer]
MLTAAMLLSSSAQAADIMVPPGAQPYADVVVKDVPMRARLALGFDAALILNLEPAQRAKLKIFPLLGKQKIRNALLPAGEATVRFNLVKVAPRGHEQRRMPTVWVDKPIATDADGILSALALSGDRLVFRLGADAPGARSYRLPRDGKGSASMEARVGDQDVRVTLELNSPETILNARAGEALIAAGMVRRVNAVGLWRPFPGVALPFQRLVARDGATLMGLPIINAAVRITEAEARRIDAEARAGTSTEADDEDAITVTASRKGKRGRSPWVLVGRDTLDRCSTIALDRPGESWELACRF